jgi:quercetin dioxygenase-like cupin family protein
MKKWQLTSLVGIVIALGISIAYAHGPGQKKVTLVSQEGGVPAFGETVTTVFERAIPNVPGKSLTALEVSYAPGGKSSSHFHAKSAFIYAYVLSGAIRSQVGDEPAKVYKAGEGWYENPGSHHRISENASASEPASLLAVIIADPGDTLTIPEEK